MNKQNEYSDACSSVPRVMTSYPGQKQGGIIMHAAIHQLSSTATHQECFRASRRTRRWRVMGLLALSVCASLGLAVQANAGVGCDFNVRINNMTPNAVMVYGESKSSASLAGKKLWSPLRGLVDTVLDPKNSGANAHYKQSVELKLPCWNGKRDFRFTYLDRSTPKIKQRNGVKMKSGSTIQINIP